MENNLNKEALKEQQLLEKHLKELEKTGSFKFYELGVFKEIEKDNLNT